MPARRVALLSNRSVFAAGVQELLSSVDGMELSVVDAGDPAAIEALDRLKPDVIVLDTEDAAIGRAAVVRVLEIRPQARVVALNLNHSAIDVYRMKRVIPTDLASLLRAIEGPVRPRARSEARRAPREQRTPPI